MLPRGIFLSVDVVTIPRNFNVSTSISNLSHQFYWTFNFSLAFATQQGKTFPESCFTQQLSLFPSDGAESKLFHQSWYQMLVG